MNECNCAAQQHCALDGRAGTVTFRVEIKPSARLEGEIAICFAAPTLIKEPLRGEE